MLAIGVHKVSCVGVHMLAAGVHKVSCVGVHNLSTCSFSDMCTHAKVNVRVCTFYLQVKVTCLFFSKLKNVNNFICNASKVIL